jgi:hypothetical protein
MMKRLIWLSLLAIFVLVASSGCVITSSAESETPEATSIVPSPDQPVSSSGPTSPAEAPVTPTPEASNFTYGRASVENVELLIQESFPVQVQAVVTGKLPDGCTEIDQATTQQEGNTFHIELTSRQAVRQACTEALVPYQETIPLDVAGLPAGEYRVNVNGITATFDLAVDNISQGVTPSSNQAVAATPTPAAPAAGNESAGIDTVEIYLIALEDEGRSDPQIGCNDSLVAITRNITPTKAPLRAALLELLAIKEQYYGQSGLYNALYQSDLQLDQVTIDETGRAIVHFSGDYSLGGVCDIPRFEAQIEATAQQFATVNDVAVFINETPMKEALSLAN